MFYGNTGSWSASFEDIACTKPVFDARPLVWLRSAGGSGAKASLAGGLVTWKDGRFEPREIAEVAGEPPVGRRATTALAPG